MLEKIDTFNFENHCTKKILLGDIYGHSEMEKRSSVPAMLV